MASLEATELLYVDELLKVYSYVFYYASVNIYI